MKFSSQKAKIFIIVLGILVILTLNFFQKEVRELFYLGSLPIQMKFWQVGDRVSDFFETIKEMKNLQEENERLELKIQELLAQNTSLQELKGENETLREALKVGLEKDFQLVFARVLGKDISQDFVLIDKGQEENLSKDMPVITQQKVLVGKIYESYNHYSKVILISHQASSFDAKIPESNISGLVKGKGSLKLFLDLIPHDQEVQEGNLLVTSQISRQYPPGLLIGLLQKIEESDTKPFQQAEISPFFDIGETENLFIITNFQ